MRRLISMILRTGIIILLPMFATTTTIYVPTDQPTILAGIEAASDGDTVLVASGTYYEDLVFGASNVYLLADQGDQSTSIEGSLHFPADLSNSSSVIGFSIHRGFQSAITIEAGNSPTIQDCLIKDNYADNGGGIYTKSQVTVIGCRFVSNSSSNDGAAIFALEADSIRIDSCWFYDNHTGNLGPVRLRFCTNSILSRNIAYNNECGGGGFVFVQESTEIRIHNNTIVRNFGHTRGLGISVDRGTEIDIRNNLIAYNIGQTDEPAIWVYSADAKAEYNNVYGNWNDDYEGISIGIGSISQPPLFFDDENRDYAPRYGSPVVSAGDPDPKYNDSYGTRNDIGALPYNPLGDSDRDGIIDPDDNCPNVSNPGQNDEDGDGLGTLCDNCPRVANEDQWDINHNAVGDACEGCCGFWTVHYTGNIDCHWDGRRNLTDITLLIDHIFISKEPICCREDGNTDGDPEGKVNLADVGRLIDHIYISKLETAPCQ